MSTPGLQDRSHHPHPPSRENSGFKGLFGSNVTFLKRSYSMRDASSTKRQAVADSSGPLDDQDATDSTTRPKNTTKRQKTSRQGTRAEQSESLDTELKTLKEQLQAKEVELKTKNDELKVKENELKAKENELKTKEGDLKAKREELHTKDQIIAQKDQDIHRKDELLQEQERQLLELRRQVEETVRDKDGRTLDLERQLRTKLDELNAANITIQSFTCEDTKVKDKHRQELEEKDNKVANMEKKFQQDSRVKYRQLKAARHTITNLRQELLSLSNTKNQELRQANDSLKQTKGELRQLLESKNRELCFLAQELCGLLTGMDLAGTQWLELLNNETYRSNLCAMNGPRVDDCWTFLGGWPSEEEFYERNKAVPDDQRYSDDSLVVYLYGVACVTDLATSNLYIHLLQALMEQLTKAKSAKIWVIMEIMNKLAKGCIEWLWPTQVSVLQTVLALLQVERLIELRWGEDCGVKKTLVGWIAQIHPSLQSLGDAVMRGKYLLDVCEDIGHVFHYENRGPATFGIIPVEEGGGFFMVRYDRVGERRQSLWAVSHDRIHQSDRKENEIIIRGPTGDVAIELDPTDENRERNRLEGLLGYALRQ